jgi:hypothetical protein
MSRRVLAVAGLAVVLVIAWGLAQPGKVATIAYRGASVDVELPRWSIRLGGREGRASYLTWGSPDLQGALSTPGPEPDFRHVEQMGAAHFFEAGALRLIAVTRKKTRLLTLIDMRVEPVNP